MSPEIAQLLGIIFAPTGIVALIAGGIMYSMKSKHVKELIDTQSNADDKKQENENFARLIETIDKKSQNDSLINSQMITAFGDLIKQHSDTGKTHREVSQSHTTALDTNTKTLERLGERLIMSSDSTDNHFKEMAGQLESIIEFLETIRIVVSTGNNKAHDKMETVILEIGNLAKKLESLENAPVTSVSVPTQEIATNASNIDLSNVQTAKQADNLINDTKDSE